MIAHGELNDRDRRGPGRGEQRFACLFAALAPRGKSGDIALEPFDHVPDGPAVPARAIGDARGLLEAFNAQ